MGLSETILAAMIGAVATVSGALFQLFMAWRSRKVDSRPKKGTTARSLLSILALMVASAAGGFLYSEFLKQRNAEDLRAMRDELKDMRALIAQGRDLTAQLVLAQRVGERHFEVGFLERLADEIGGAEFHRLHHRGGAPLTREHDDRHFAVDLLECGQRREPVHLARHHHVEDDGGGTITLVALHRLFRAAQRDRLIASLCEKRSQEVAHRLVVVDDHHLRFAVEIDARHALLLSNAGARAEKFWCD